MEDLGILGTVIGIAVVSAASWAMFQFAPRIQSALDNGVGIDGNESNNKSLQPLYKVFYKFSHNSSDEWISWILVQDNDVQTKAYEKLRAYLEEAPEELGIATQEVIKALLSFKQPTNFEILNNLLMNIRSHLGQLKSIDLFYPDLCKSLLEVDFSKGLKSLKYELALLNEKKHTEFNIEEFKISIIRALGSVKNVNDELKDTYTKILIDRNYNGLLRKELIKTIRDKDESITSYVYAETLKSHTESSSQVLNKDNQMVLEEMFHSFKGLIKNNNTTIWDLVIKACYHDSTRELYSNLIANMVAKVEETFHENQLLDILNSQEPIRDRFRTALADRFKVTESELSIFKMKLKPEDIHFNKETIIIEKSKKTKVIAAELLEVYHQLEENLNQESGQINKAERKARHAISIIAGTGVDEKIYLLRGLAANVNRSFVYLDLPKLILSTTELNKLISTISNSKPSIVFIDNLLEVFEKELDTEEEIGLKHFLKSVKELAILPNVAFYGGLAVSEFDIAAEKELQNTITSGSKGSYKSLTNIDKPSQENRKDLIQESLDKISAEKFAGSFNLEELLEETENSSMLEFLSYTVNFLEKCLMLHGKILSAKEVCKESNVCNDFEDQTASDPDREGAFN